MLQNGTEFVFIFYYSARGHAIGVNQRGFWCESESEITGSRRLKLVRKRAPLGALTPPSGANL